MAEITITIQDVEGGEVDIVMHQAIPLYQSDVGYYPFTPAESAAQKLRTALFRVLSMPDEEDTVN